MEKIDLLQRPQIKRNFDPNWRKEKNRILAKKFDKEFFDGKRVNGYGGYVYDGRWIGVAQRLKKIYKLNEKSSFLDIGCGKGFLLYDLKEIIPRINISGIDISKYAIENGMEEIKPYLSIGSAENLPYATNSFDFVFSSDTIHNLPRKKCKKALQEMVRVCKSEGNMFIQIDAYTTREEKMDLDAWNLTALTYMHVDKWLDFFKEVGYKGDYFWTIMR
ncbi:class I SAM-dependent methyltransferase [Candidatus Pacearchaeota archaeon]|nr:class I SAM-dependent methyltransferase [Candidatus Pacearchaeota archaeon]